jgi:hypothetical protein
VRTQLNQLWAQVRETNAKEPVPEEQRIRVTFYFGQNVDDLEGASVALQADTASSSSS